MIVWVINEFSKIAEDREEFSDFLGPYISPEVAMENTNYDLKYLNLHWRKVEVKKMDGTVLTHWEAETEDYRFVLESYNVEGSE